MHDVLQHFSPVAMSRNKDFDLYRQIHWLHAEGRRAEIDQLRHAAPLQRDSVPPGKGLGWVLDKYKFLHVVDAAHELQPGRDWYLFIETDTYVSWASLRRWLADFDPSRRWFLGNAIQKDPVTGASYYAQGGSGFILSRGIVEEIAGRKLASTWDFRAAEWNAGDILFSDFVHRELNLSVTNSWPEFNEHNATGVAFAQKTWCTPVVTLHRVEGPHFYQIFETERALGFRGLKHADIYRVAYPRGFHFPASRSDWDNLSESAEHRIFPTAGADANKDLLHCQHACSVTPGCFQWLFRNTTLDTAQPMHECILSAAFRLGQPKSVQLAANVREPGISRSWTSGWCDDRIQQWIEEQGTCDDM